MGENEPRRGEQFSQKTLDLLKAKHDVVKNAYLEEDGVHGQYCGEIAKELAACLKDEGKAAVIMGVEKRDDDGHFLDLHPLAYRHRQTEWTSHQVCCYGGMALDPIIGHPVPVSEYTERVFGERIEMQVYDTAEEVAEILARRDARKGK